MGIEWTQLKRRMEPIGIMVTAICPLANCSISSFWNSFVMS